MRKLDRCRNRLQSRKQQRNPPLKPWSSTFLSCYPTRPKISTRRSTTRLLRQKALHLRLWLPWASFTVEKQYCWLEQLDLLAKPCSGSLFSHLVSISTKSTCWYVTAAINAARSAGLQIVLRAKSWAIRFVCNARSIQMISIMQTLALLGLSVVAKIHGWSNIWCHIPRKDRSRCRWHYFTRLVA